MVLNKERFFFHCNCYFVVYEIFIVFALGFQILNHKDRTSTTFTPTPNIVCSGIKAIFFHQIDDFLFLAVSETCIIVILILSKLTTKIVFKTFFHNDNIYITNGKIEIIDLDG
jgi:hypothetical protein